MLAPIEKNYLPLLGHQLTFGEHCTYAVYICCHGNQDYLRCVQLLPWKPGLLTLCTVVAMETSNTYAVYSCCHGNQDYLRCVQLLPW